MRERPIIFNTEMVKAILDGRKTVTRRPVTFKEGNNHGVSRDCYSSDGYDVIYGRGVKKQPFDSPERIKWFFKCPFGQIGDRLYVRETWCHGVVRNDGDYEHPESDYIDQDGSSDDTVLYYQEMLDEGILDDEDLDCRAKWKPSIHMQKKHARIWLEVTDIRVERVQDITEEQVDKEGCTFVSGGLFRGSRRKNGCLSGHSTSISAFSSIWNSIYNNWSDNPWVWVIEFKRIEK